ncbi:MAG TPA: C40 family peptidase [Salinivirga sp.]|uniref:C40 family peptidase n=1 Tax=Salinivirga sp. TaxID=1970192 RepID=UPI002B46564A|nr:C40 family peptidase [Salinivirga sp.]HKK58739.1 C40 family peptidase [Salinivirga sp.]
MKYGVCTLSQIAVRAEKAESSELVTQMLFGETCKIIDQKGSWFFVYTDLDQYLGWVDIKTLKNISQKEYRSLNTIQHPKLTTPYGIINIDNKKLVISISSTLPFLKNGQGKIGDQSYQLLNGDTQIDQTPSEIAESLMGAPYLWGGRTLMGIDCSALVLNTFKLWNYLLPRDSSEQVSYGQTIAFLSEAKEGDVCFFDNQEGKITHIGILTKDKKIVHASGEVRIDSIDHQGIYNKSLNRYTHHLRVIKRFKI